MKGKNIQGYAPYRVYEIEKKQEASVPNFTGLYTKSGTGGKSSYTTKYQTSDRISKTNWQKFWEVGLLSIPQYEVRWLKSKQATMLMLKGHRVEPTTADDKSTVGPTRLSK